MKHLLWPQCYEARYQLQEKNCKKHKHMEIKQHVSNNQQVTEEINMAHYSVQLLSCVRLCDPSDCSTPGFLVHHQLLEFIQTHVIQPSHPLSSPFLPALNLSQHQCLFHWVSSSHQLAKVLEFQLQHQPFNEYSGLNIIREIQICSLFSSVQSLSHVQLFATPWIAARQASLSITNSRSLLKLMSIESVMPSSHLILCRPLLLLPPIPPSIRVFSNELVLRIRWPKDWSFSFNISPSN